MKKGNTVFSILAVITVIVAVAALVIIFRDRLESFLSEMHDKYVAAKEDMFTPDEFSDYADVD